MTTFIWPYDGNQVSLAGTFNNWVPQPMSRDNDLGFSLTLPLENGEYQYKFVIDGRRWCYDLLNPSTTDDRGNRNNFIEIGGDARPQKIAKGRGVTQEPKGRTGPPPKIEQERSSEKEKGGPPPKPQERKSEKERGGPPPKPQERKSEKGDEDGSGKKQQRQQKQPRQPKQQQQKQEVPNVAEIQSSNLIKTVKSYGVPFYVGDVDCDNSVEDVIQTAQLFQKALPDVGCMLISGGVEKFIVVTVVPENKTSNITALEWVNAALSIVPGFEGVGSDTFAQGQIPANPEGGIFPIKLKDLCRGPTFVLLRSRGLVKEEESEDEMYFFDE